MKLSRKKVSIAINVVLSTDCEAAKCHWAVFSLAQPQSDNRIAFCLGWNWLEDQGHSMCSKIKMYLRTDSVLLPGTVAVTLLLYPTSLSLHISSQSLLLHCWQRWHSSLCANCVQWWWLTAQLTWYVPALCFLHEGDHTAASGSAVVNGFVFSNVPEWPIRLQWFNALVEIWEHW